MSVSRRLPFYFFLSMVLVHVFWYLKVRSLMRGHLLWLHTVP
jgi:hypothetical protein